MASFCVECGAALVGSRKFCAQCGARAAVGPEDSAYTKVATSATAAQTPGLPPPAVVQWWDWVAPDPTMGMWWWWRDDVDPDTIPVAVLRGLARDENWGPRARAATHPRLPIVDMRMLADDPDEQVRAYVAANPELPADIAAVLANDKSFVVRSALAKNEATPPQLLRRLAEDEFELAANYAKANPNYPG